MWKVDGLLALLVFIVRVGLAVSSSWSLVRKVYIAEIDWQRSVQSVSKVAGMNWSMSRARDGTVTFAWWLCAESVRKGFHMHLNWCT